MPVSLYVGAPRSGKTYTVVKEVILPAISIGRRVVTNIDGLEYELMLQYLAETQVKRPVAGWGTICKVSDDQIKSPSFFPIVKEDTDKFLQAGDLLVLDEALRYFPKGEFISKAAYTYLCEHGHFVSSDGISSDICLMVQSEAALHPLFKGLLEMSYKIDKKTELGLSKKYRIQSFKGWPFIKNTLSSAVYSYDSRIFNLYHSTFAGSLGKSAVVPLSDRENLFKSPRFRAMMIGTPIVLLVSGFLLYHQLNSGLGVKKNDPSVSTSRASVASSPPPSKPVAPVPSNKWRIAGYVITQQGGRVVVRSADDLVRLENPSSFQFLNDEPVSGEVDGEYVTRYSGQGSSSPASGFSIPAPPMGKQNAR